LIIIVKHDIEFHVSSSATQEIVVFLGKFQSIIRGLLLRREERGKMGGETEKQRGEEWKEKGTHQHFYSKH